MSEEAKSEKPSTPETPDPEARIRTIQEAEARKLQAACAKRQRAEESAAALRDLVQRYTGITPTPGKVAAPPADAGNKRAFFEARCQRRGFPNRHVAHVGVSFYSVEKANLEAVRLLKSSTSRADGSLLVLTGNRGSGKTQMAADIAMPHLENPKDAENTWPRYCSALELFRQVRGAYGPTALQSEAQILTTFIRPEILIIDELQEGNDSEFEDRILTEIVDRRYGGMTHTILIANLLPEALRERLGRSIVSRMDEIGVMIECTWRSHREKRAAERVTPGLRMAGGA